MSLDDSTLEAALEEFRRARKTWDDRERQLLVDVTMLKTQVADLLVIKETLMKWAIGAGFGGAAVATAVVQMLQGAGT